MYRALPLPSEQVHAEADSTPFDDYEDYESFRNHTVPYPQYFSPGSPHITTNPWGDEDRGDLEPQAGESALQRMSDASTRPDWLPYTLRWPWLTWIIILTAILEILVITAHATSSRRLGLVDDDGSRSVVVVSTFIPTLLAVTQGFFLSVLLNDVKRTQAFANLASPSGASGKLSLTLTVDGWWESLFVSLPGRRGKKTSWALLCATVAFMFSFIVVSPFSSTLLVSRDVLFTQAVPFSRLDLTSTLPLQGNALSTTYFRTVGSLLQNVTTSAWVTDKYTVVPFWPSTMNRAPLGPTLSDSVGTWSARTIVFAAEMNCEQMTAGVRPLNATFFEPSFHLNTTTDAHEVVIQSASGCVLNVTFADGSRLAYGLGGTVWSTVRDTTEEDFQAPSDWPPLFSIAGCNQDEIVFLSKSLYHTTTMNATVTGQACNTTYYMGEPTVTVSLEGSGSLVHVDEQEYLSVRKPLPDTVVDLPSFERLFFNKTSWSAHLTEPEKTARGFGYGAAGMFTAVYDFDPGKTIADASYVQNLRRVKQRFFGELMRDAFDTTASDPAIETSGLIGKTRRRIVVSRVVAIILEIALLIQITLLSVILITTRLSRRPLGLFTDPAPAIRVAELFSGDTVTLQSLDGLHDVGSKDLDLALAQQTYQLVDGQICLKPSDGPKRLSGTFVSKKRGLQPSTLLDPKKSEMQSLTFATWMFIALLCLLSAALIVIAYLYWYAQAFGLYQTAFVFEFDVSIGNLSISDVNPASLVTTVVAVSIALWWGALETTLRRIQPFLALAGTPPTKSGSEAVSLSYRSSYLLWATWRALRRSHWILALVCTGAFLSEIFTIAMSSLWSRQSGSLPSVVNVTRQLELRHVPHLSTGTSQFTSRAGNYKQDLLSELFDNVRTSWIYGAAVQTSLNGSEPPWSSGGWSFVPYDPSSVSKSMAQKGGNRTKALKRSMNATVDTPAIRARLECSPYEHLDLKDSKNWLTEWDLRNTTQWHKDNHTKAMTRAFDLGLSDMRDNTILYLDRKPDRQGNYTSFFVTDKWFQCCQNKTGGGVGTGSVGYWSANLRNGSYYPDFASTWPANFTVKWIHGKPIEGYCYAQEDRGCVPRLLWEEKPRMAALNCMPVMETANASVTVSIPDGRVVDFTLRDEPQPDEHAWSDNFRVHRYSNSSESGFNINITTSQGVLFVTGLLGAADLAAVVGTDLDYYTVPETLSDQTFNIRAPGLNVDLMTYSMLSLVNYDHEALLDLDTLRYTAQKTFTALFQNYASTNVSLETGGWVFQTLSEELPDDLDGPTSKTSVAARATPAGDTSQVVMHLSNAVEVLKMSTPAAWICLAILAYLIAVGVALTVSSRTYRKMLIRRIDSIADVAVLVAGSNQLLNMARQNIARRLNLSPGVLVWLGWFVDEKGTTRWGLEVFPEQEANATGHWYPSSSQLVQEDLDDVTLGPGPSSSNTGEVPMPHGAGIYNPGHQSVQDQWESHEMQFLRPGNS
ncbi:hypothetical protein F5Y17DRAFT_451155 [Xylariaceae sp. FL0594]|nr:hypothetical protein F5Y17DRAFT_451155 [Xylariaceae sp. FL0594]